MKTAISIQAFASSINKQIFIASILSPAKILAGEPSKCELTSYSRYMQNQKYQNVAPPPSSEGELMETASLLETQRKN